MSFDGIWIWDSKYGTPEINEVNEFKEKLYSLPTSKEKNLHAFWRFFEKFAQEASEYYNDDAFTNFVDYAHHYDDKLVEPIFCFNELPDEAFEYYRGAIITAALENDLVIYDANLHEITSPDEYSPDEDFELHWIKHLAELKKSAIDESELLPMSFSQVKKFKNSLIRKKLESKNIKVKKIEDVGFSIELDSFTLNLVIEANKDDEVFYIEERMLVYLYGYISIHLKDYKLIGDTDFYGFYKKPYEPEKMNMGKRHYIYAETAVELEDYVNKCVDMLMYVYPHCSSFNSLYHFFKENRDDDRLKIHYFDGSVQLNTPRAMLKLAKLSNQTDYDSLKGHYKNIFVTERMNELLLKKRYFEEEELRLSKIRVDKKKYEFNFPDNPEQQFIEEFEQFCNHLESNDK